MDGPDPISDLGLDCPFNGTFYICKDSPTRFIGCCTSNPCGDRKGLCPDEHLEPATYEARYRIPPQDCVNDNFAVSWYTCPKTRPPFLGCCAVDPCSRGGCPDRELRAAKLSDKKSDADLFVGGKSPGSGSKGKPSAKLSITTATLTASYISTKTIDAGMDATSTLDSASPGEKGMPAGHIAAIIIGTFIGSFIIGGTIAYFYWRHKYGRRVNTAGDNQSSSRRSTSPSTVSSSQKRRISIPGSIYAIRDSRGHITGFEDPSRIPLGQGPGQETHTRASSEEQHLQQGSREIRTQQPQPGHDTRLPVPRISVEAPSQGQNSRLNPSTPRPPYPTSDRQNGSDQGTTTQPDHRDYRPWSPSANLPGNTAAPLFTAPLSITVNKSSSPVALPRNMGRPHSTGHPSTLAPIFELPGDTEMPLPTTSPITPVVKPSSPIVNLPANTETTLPTGLPLSTPIDRPSSPIFELSADTEIPHSTTPPSAPNHHLSRGTVCHEPGAKLPEFPLLRPTTTTDTAPVSDISDISEEQHVEHLNSSDTGHEIRRTSEP